jgi:hypothetical protein
VQNYNAHIGSHFESEALLHEVVPQYFQKSNTPSIKLLTRLAVFYVTFDLWSRSNVNILHLSNFPLIKTILDTASDLVPAVESNVSWAHIVMNLNLKALNY